MTFKIPGTVSFPSLTSMPKIRTSLQSIMDQDHGLILTCWSLVWETWCIVDTNILTQIFWYKHFDTNILTHTCEHLFESNKNLSTGNFGLSDDQSRAQMSIWSILAAPLLMSNDLRRITAEQRKILLNRDVIAIDQDELGILGKRVLEKKKLEVWLKPVTPKVNGLFSFAVVYFNRNTLGSTIQVITFTEHSQNIHRTFTTNIQIQTFSIYRFHFPFEKSWLITTQLMCTPFMICGTIHKFWPNLRIQITWF